MTIRTTAPAAARNSAAILGVLRTELRTSACVLEIGSGTGQHAVFFGAAMPALTWQTSDLAEQHADIDAWLADASLSNVLAPLEIDVRTARAENESYDAVFSANTAHIMHYAAVESMFAFVSRALRDRGLFVLYGPMRRNGRFNTHSNAIFHRSLQSRDAGMGIRDLEDLDSMAESGNMRRVRLYAMPANNHVIIWRRRARNAENGET